MATVAGYGYRYILSSSILSGTVGLFITTFPSCDTTTPQAYGIIGSYVPFKGSSTGSLFQICPNATTQAPYTGLTIAWDGTTMGAPDGFTVVYNGDTVTAGNTGSTILDLIAKLLGWTSSNTSATIQCSDLPSGGKAAVCTTPHVSSESVWSKYKWFIIGGGIGVAVIIVFIIILVMMKHHSAVVVSPDT